MSTKQQEIEIYAKEYEGWSKSELHKESLRIANAFIATNPNTFKEELRTNRKLQAVNQLINELVKMKYYLSIDFYGRGEVTNLKIGDLISFVSLKGLIKTGAITYIRYLKYSKVPTEYRVDCNGKSLIAVCDYVIRKDSKVLNLKSSINELDEGFALRT